MRTRWGSTTDFTPSPPFIPIRCDITPQRSEKERARQHSTDFSRCFDCYTIPQLLYNEVLNIPNQLHETTIMVNLGALSKRNSRLGVSFFFILIILLNVQVVLADISETDTIHSSIDTFVSLLLPLSNYGDTDFLIVSKSTLFPGVTEAYLQFDLTRLPEGITVKSAVLKIGVGKEREVHRLFLYIPVEIRNGMSLESHF